MLNYREYQYASSDPGYSDGYLAEPVLQLLSGCGTIGRLLDGGCGNGSLARLYTHVAQEVYAFDLSESGVEMARKNLGAQRARVASAYDDFAALFPGVTSFDAVVSCEVIEHLYEPRKFLQRAHAALAPGGHLIVSTPYHGYLKNLVLAATGKMDAHFTALWDGGHIKFWSRATLTELLLECGFDEVCFRGAGRLPLLWKSMVLRARKPPSQR